MCKSHQLKYYIDLIQVLTLKEIKIRYKNSFLGYFWSVLHPLTFALIFYFAFKFVLKIPIENYTLFLITGLFPWQWITNSICGGTGYLLGNASLIKKVTFPKYLILLSLVLHDGFHFLISLPVIFGFLIFYHYPIYLSCIYGILLLTGSQFFIIYGITLLVSSVNLFFRDLERLVSLGLTIIFYATPIIYDLSFVPQIYQKYFLFNPFYSLIENWRNLFLKGFIDWKLYFLSLFYAGLFFLIGFLVFKKLSWRFAEVV